MGALHWRRSSSRIQRLVHPINGLAGGHAGEGAGPLWAIVAGVWAIWRAPFDGGFAGPLGIHTLGFLSPSWGSLAVQLAMSVVAMSAMKGKNNPKKDGRFSASGEPPVNLTRRRFLAGLTTGGVIAAIEGYRRYFSEPSRESPVRSTPVQPTAPQEGSGIAPVQPGSLDPRIAREQLRQLFIKNNYFQDEIEHMALPAQFGLTREEMREGVHDLANLIATSPFSISYGGRYRRVYFAINADGSQYALSGDLFADLIQDGSHVLLHESIHRTRTQKQRGRQIAQAEAQLAEGLRPFWTPQARAANADPASVLNGGGWDINALKSNAALASMARTILQGLWVGELQAHYVELSLFDLKARQQGMDLKGYLESKLRELARQKNRPYAEYIRTLSNPAVLDSGRKWLTALQMADYFSPTEITPGLDVYIFEQLLNEPSRQRLVVALARVDLLVGSDRNLFADINNNVASQRRFQEWARRTILHAAEPPARRLSRRDMFDERLRAFWAAVGLAPIQSQPRGDRYFQSAA